MQTQASRKHILIAVAMMMVMTVLGHDALMAMGPHSSPQRADIHASHDDPQVQTCGVQEGKSPSLRTMDDPPPAALSAITFVSIPVAAQHASLGGWLTPSIDASSLRILFQVFLN